MGGIPTMRSGGPPLPNPPPRGGRGFPQSGRKSAHRRLATGARQARDRGIRSKDPASGPRRARHARALPGNSPDRGLACGVLHEVAAAAHGDRPAAFGFLFALTAAALAARPGVALFIASRRALADFGALYGHGLAQLGLDVGRLLLVETRTDKDALWALEETLRSGAAARHGRRRDCRRPRPHPSRRLNLAAAAHGNAARPPARLRRRGHKRGGDALAHRRGPRSPRPLRRLRAPPLARGAGALPQRPSRAMAHRVEPCRASFPSG